MGTFGACLFKGNIGTPIGYENVRDLSDSDYRHETRKWLGAVLAAHAARAESEAPVVHELLRQFEMNIETTEVMGEIPSVLVMRTDIIKE